MALRWRAIETTQESLYQTGNIEIDLQGRRAHKEHINHLVQNESLPRPWIHSLCFSALNIKLNVFSYPRLLFNI